MNERPYYPQTIRERYERGDFTESALSEVDGVRIGSTWRRNPPGREVVRVERAWFMDGEPTVRAHPVRGGKPLVASTQHLRERYTEVTA